ncbi:hypothetical protein ABVT39_017132 [Epinephelus coioides]
MDVVSLSPSNDDFFAHDPEDQAPSVHTLPQADPASEAEDFPADAVPDTPPPWVLRPSKKHVSPTSCISSAIHIPPGSSLHNLHKEYSSPAVSTASPSSLLQSERRGRNDFRTTHRRRRNSPTPSPDRVLQPPRHHGENTGRSSQRQSHRHHAPARSPEGWPPSKMTNWTVATLQNTVRDKSIPFHCTDNKVKLFNLLMSACHGRRSAGSSPLLHDVTTHTPT